MGSKHRLTSASNHGPALTLSANLKRLIGQHKEEMLQCSGLDWDRVQSTTYLYEFDRVVQTVSWGYPTEEAYYRDSSSSDAVLAIRIPFLAISAADDPVGAMPLLFLSGLELELYWLTRTDCRE